MNMIKLTVIGVFLHINKFKTTITTVKNVFYIHVCMDIHCILYNKTQNVSCNLHEDIKN
jgi:hypothetical protein